MEFVILNLKLPEIVSVNLVGSIPDLHHLLQVGSIFTLILKNNHELFKVFFLLLQVQELLQFLERGEEVLLTLLVEGLVDQKQLEGTGAVYALRLTLHLRKRKIGVDDHLPQQIHFLLHR
jgi:hypothetical protein